MVNKISKLFKDRKSAIITTTIVAGVIALSLSLSQSNLLTSQKENNNSNKTTNTTNNVIGNFIGDNIFKLDTNNIPTRDNYIFLGYAREADATEADYEYDSETNTFSPDSVTINAPEEDFEATLTLYVVWQPVTFDMAYEKYGKEKYTAIDGNSYYAMQDITQDICDNVAIGTFEVPNTGTLVDKRDGKTYQVSKLKMTPDGTKATCWMSQNLALVLGTKLTNELTDLNSVTEWMPVRGTIATGSLNSSTWQNDNNTPYSYNSGRTDYGVYYNWSSAVASNNTSSMTAQYFNAPDSVCPKGWRLPQIYGGSSTNRPNEFGNLLYAYGIINNAWPGDDQNAASATNGYTKTPINIPPAGQVANGMVYDNGGILWYSNVGPATYAYTIAINNPTSVRPSAASYRTHGRSVRCILR